MDNENVELRNTPIRIGPAVENIEIDFSTARVIRIQAVNARGSTKEYLLKITSKGRALLV
jgi:hypothetical protein